MKIAYLINQYPKVSHTFIRREILAMEKQGFDVQRIALRGWADTLVDDEDLRERERTRYILQGGVSGLVKATLGALLARPGRFFSAAALALRVSRRAERPWPLHLIYLAEACVMVGWMRAAGVRHLHVHFGTNPAEVAMLAAELGGPSYSVTIHGSEEWDKPEALHLGEKMRRAAFVVAISSFCRSQVYRWLPYTQWPKVSVVHCGVDSKFHTGVAHPMPAAPRLVCVGRLCEQKGQLLLVRAVAQLAAKGLAVELVLAGDGEMREEIESLISRHELQDKVRITGWLSGDQVRDELLAARALVLPSFAEGLPVVVMEAMALRRPVLTTYIGAIPELVRDGRDGWLIPAGDVDALVVALERLLATPLETLAAMGEGAHLRAVERHSADTEAGKLARLFRQQSDVAL